MLEMIKARRERGEKGFTLAELLIVVAIIAVLVAIAIPVFTTQLERSRESTDISNVRSAYAEVMADYLTNGADTAKSMKVKARQKVASWQGPTGTIVQQISGSETELSFDAVVSGSYTVKISKSGTVTID